MPTQGTSFLSLPVELRLLFYNIFFGAFLTQDPRATWGLTYVSHQIRAETLQFILGASRTSRGISSFIDWTSRGYPHLLSMITSWSLLWPTQYYFRAGAMPRESAYFGTPLLKKALKTIPDVQSLRLHMTRDDPSWQAKDYEAILRMISTFCAKLYELSVYTDLFHLDVLAGFQNLTCLHWCGYSLSTPRKTMFILKALPRLISIHLALSSKYIDEFLARPGHEISKQASFTSDVLQRLKPLKQLSIRHEDWTRRSDFFTVSMLQALECHRQSLQHLELTCDAFASREVIEEILAFTMTSRLSFLRIVLTSVPQGYEGLDVAAFVGSDVRIDGEVKTSIQERQPPQVDPLFDSLFGFPPFTVGHRRNRH